MSSKATLAAAALMGATTAIHLFMGGPEVHQGLLAAPLTEGLKAFASILWHAVSINLLVFTVGILWLARRPNPGLEAAMAAVQIGFAALFLFYGATRLGTVWLMPQWVIFLAIPALTRFGQSRQKRQ